MEKSGTDLQTIQHLLCLHSGVSIEKVQAGNLTAEEWDKLIESAKMIINDEIIINKKD